jgi:hypothetical protein
MLISDGIYCDASYDDFEGVAVISVVRVLGGDVTDAHRRTLLAEGSTEAEEKAILLAQALYPGQEIHNDNSSACALIKVKWLPRAFNGLAHTIASSRLKKIRRVHSRKGGRGVVPAGTSRYLTPPTVTDAHPSHA